MYKKTLDQQNWIEIVDSKVAVPTDLQRRYKFPVTLLYGTKTSDGNTGDIEIEASAIDFVIKVTSASGTDPVLNVYIEGKFEPTGDYKVIASRENITTTGTYYPAEQMPVYPLTFRYLRVRWTVSGSFTFTVAGQAMI